MKNYKMKFPFKLIWKLSLSSIQSQAVIPYALRLNLVMLKSVFTRIGLTIVIVLFGYTVCGQQISTVAGKDEPGFFGDGGLATDARLEGPWGVAVDVKGDVFIADDQNTRIRRVDAVTGIISTYAGTGVFGYNGDGFSAITAQLHNPRGICFDNSGGLLIADYGNHRIRRIDTSTNIITTVAGSGNQGFFGDGGSALQAQLDHPIAVSVDDIGNIYITDQRNHRIRKVDTNGIIYSIAGGGNVLGDNGLATSAKLFYPNEVVVDKNGNIFIADGDHYRIRKVDSSGIITTIAGTGVWALDIYDGPALQVKIAKPFGLAIDFDGNILFSESTGQTIRKLDFATDSIKKIAGTGFFGYSGDGGDPLLAQLDGPSPLYLDTQGNIFFGEVGSNVVRKISGLTGSAPLPIELLQFDVRCVDPGVELKWKTRTEINNDYFSIERSTDGENWETISVKEGAGNSNILLRYSCLDDNPGLGWNYYRLRQTDFNGEFTLYSAQAVNCLRSAYPDLTLYPNPSKDMVEIKSENRLIRSITFINQTGHRVSHLQNLETLSLKLNLTSWSPGVYSVLIDGEGFFRTERLILISH